MIAFSRRIWLLLPAILLATALAYQPAWHGGMLWDDDAHVTAPAMRTVSGLWRIWTEPGATQQYYPLAHTAFWLQHRVWGDATLGYHLLNIVLHASSAFLLVLILRRLAVAGALLAGVFFALHPVHVESVAWITELKNTLSGFFYFAAALAYIRFDAGRQRWRYWVSVCLFVAALMTKTVTATLPAALLVVFWWKRGHLSWRSDVMPLMPLLALGVGAGLTTAWVERTYIGAVGTDFDLTLVERTLLAARALWFYAGTLVWPRELTFIYPRWHIDQGDPRQYLYLAGAVAVVVAAWMCRRRTRAPLTIALLFAGTLFPALGFFNVYPFRYSFVADHFVYLASAAPLAFLSAGITMALARQPRFAGQLPGVVACGLLAVLTWQQSRQYTDAATLYRATLARNPACWMCHNNLASVLLEAGDSRIAEALSHIDRSLEINPRNAEAHSNRGVVLRRIGRADEAIASATEATRLSPTSPDAHMNLGVALRAAGKVEESLPHFLTVTRLTARAVDAHEHAGSVLLELGRIDAAMAHLEAALRLRPDHPGVHDKIGVALVRAGRVDDALVHFGTAVASAPSDAGFRNNMASALASSGRTQQALDQYAESLRLNPDSAKTHDNMGHVLLSSGRRAEALQHFEAALAVDPGYAPAKVNLANQLVDAGRVAEAISRYLEVLEAPAGTDLAQVHGNLGVAYAMSGRTRLAIRHFEEALRLRPDFAEARANLARARGR